MAGVLVDNHALPTADDPAGRHVPPARHHKAVRHDLHHDRRRARYQDIHRLVLPLHGRVHPIPSFAGNRGKLDIPGADGRHCRLDGAPTPEEGGRMTVQVLTRRRRRRRIPFGRILLIGGFALFVLVPLYWMFVTSIKPSDDYLAVPPVWFPSEPTTVHYTAALFAYRGLKGLTNSLIISLSATVLSAL